MRAISLFFACLVFATPAAATNSKPELAKVLEDFLAWLPGEYTSIPQVYLERALGTPPDGEHETYYRVFAEIDAPHLAEHVICTQIRIGADNESIFPGQQQVFLISTNEEMGTVSISGRRIADAGNFVDAHLHPEMWANL